MGLFGSGTSKHEADVEKATNENNISEDWAVIMDICDKAGKNTDEAKNYLKAVLRRLANTDPHIAIQAVTLLDACVKNSGKTFHLEIASREFENEYTKLIQKSHPKVVQKLKESLKRWAEEDAFKSDPQLSLIPALYTKLKSEGVDFSNETPTKKTVILSKDPNVVQSQEEEDQIAKAIELSLKDVSSSPKHYTNPTSTLYPSTNLAATTVSSANPPKDPRKVRALYDFEAAEDNELTFLSGEVILVTDDTDPNWWKGSNHRGQGLFPANFVTSDLHAEPEPEKKKSLEFDEENCKSTASSKQLKDLENVEINEDKIDRLLHLLHEADPTNSDKDTQEMQNLEREVNTMGPLIDTELERIDRKHAQLTQLSSDLVEALNLYHTLMPEPQIASVTKGIPYMAFPPGMQGLPPMYNGNMANFSVPPTMMVPPFASIPPGQERPFMLPQNMQMAHFPPGMHPPPNHILQQHAMTSMQPMSGMPQHSIPPQVLPPGMHHTAPQQPQTMHRMPPQSIQQGPFPSHGTPNFQPGSMPPNFSQNGPPMTQTAAQNGPPGSQNAVYPQPSNTHIM